MIIGLTLALLLAILYVAPFASFFRVTSLNLGEWGTAFLVAAVSVLWFEVFKWTRRKKGKEASAEAPSEIAPLANHIGS